MDRTLPLKRFPDGFKVDSSKLAAGRYGTFEMCEIWGDTQTFERSLFVQGQSALVLSELYPEIISPENAREIASHANLDYINPERIRKLEFLKGHDVIAINESLEEVVSPEARTHINRFKTSADTTQNARALQIKSSLEVVANSVENLRDIVIEKSLDWIDVPFMVLTHGYDAAPSVAGRPLSHYAEMLQSGLNVLKFFYDNSIKGKWADTVGDHHSATSSGVDGMRIQEEFCKRIGVGFMDASAQIPGLEFEADLFYAVSRLGETTSNLANFIAWGRSDDVNVFVNTSPQKKKGSSGMPHKDAKNGNPTSEEQNMSLRNYLQGNVMTALANCQMPYARNLAASANGRINLEDGFKFFDHATREMAKTIYWIGINEERSKERVSRSYGVVTSQQVMTYLTDHRMVTNPMGRGEAHNLMGKLATESWERKIPFVEIVLANDEVRKRLSEDTIRRITNPFDYIGRSKEIVRIVADKFYKQRTFV